MATDNAILVDSCRRALAGEDSAGFDIIGRVSDPSKLSQIGKAAWINLRFWEQDAGKQAIHPALQELNRTRLQDLLELLEAR